MLYLIFFIILLFILYYSYYSLEKFKNTNLNEMRQLFLNNQNKIFKINLNKKKENLDECFKKCNFNDCLKLKMMTENYNKCLSCQKNNNKCFNNLIKGGICDDCGDSLNKFDCENIKYYACPNLKDVYNKKGIKPYYIQYNNEKSFKTPFKQSCLFCWNLKNYL